MDTVTQAVLGAAVGQACFSHKLGRRAIWYGAAAGLIPDLDYFAAHISGPFGEYLYHRGLTHSLWFPFLLSPVCGYFAWKWAGRKKKLGKGSGDPKSDSISKGSFSAWTGLFFLSLITHPLLDIFTSYGTQIFFPFSNSRIALNAIPIIDPVYTLILVAALIIGIRAWKRPKVAAFSARFAILITSGYLFLGLYMNERAQFLVKDQLNAKEIEYKTVKCFPTIFQIFLRRVVVEREKIQMVGFITNLEIKPVKWRNIPIRKSPFIDKLRCSEEGRIFEWFAINTTCARQTPILDGMRVELCDLRWGFNGPPDWGLFGIRAEYNIDGTLKGPILPFMDKPPINRITVVDFFSTIVHGPR